MKAIMLAAGVGRRLYGDSKDQPPKALINLGGKTLLQRHVENLMKLGVDDLTVVVGYRRQLITEAATQAGRPGFVRTLHNPRFRGGPVLSLWTAREILYGGDDVLFMDADVLYHPHMLERLVRSPHANCLLMDNDIDAGEDPVRVCIRDGHLVEFGKKVEGDFDRVGEWPGFMKMSPQIARAVGEATERCVDQGRMEVTYEVAMREVMLSHPRGTFGVEDITGVPWIEIDFPSDLWRAEQHVLPRLSERYPETGAA